MARADTVTWLSLDRWAQIIGIHPLHFNGVSSAVITTQVCHQYWFQQDWQDAQKVSRETVARAIYRAERMIANQVGYNLLPDWVVDERQPTVRPPQPELFATGLTRRGAHKSLQGKKGYARSGGIRAKSVIEAGAAVVYSDADGDTYDETATITVTTTVTPCEVHVYFPSASITPFGAAAADDRWEVKPIKVTDNGDGTYAITCRREQLPLPAQWMGLAPEAINGDVDANFLTTVDVYRVYNDPQQQVQFLWLAPYCVVCGGSGCTACQQATQYGCLSVRDQRLSFLAYQPATWDAANSQFTVAEWSGGRDPDRARLWYYAGWRDESLACPAVQMDPYWEEAVAYLAVGLLDRKMCDCNNVSYFTDYWQEDLARVGRDASYQNADTVLMCPFGTTRGAQYAWQRANAEERTLGR